MKQKYIEISDLKLMLEFIGIDYSFIGFGDEVNYRKDLTFILKLSLERMGFQCLLDNNFLLPYDEVGTKLYVKLCDEFVQILNYEKFVRIIDDENLTKSLYYQD